MSFIDLLGNQVWSDHDITVRTEDMVHGVVPVIEETILNRKVAAAAMGQWTLTPEEQALLQTYTQACMEAHAEGVAARQDMARLSLCLSYENALARLLLPPVTEPETVIVADIDGNTTEIPNPAIAADQAERAVAQAVVDAVTQDTLDLWTLRHPALPDPEPEPEFPPLESTNG